MMLIAFSIIGWIALMVWIVSDEDHSGERGRASEKHRDVEIPYQDDRHRGLEIPYRY